jgi:hypothetical protein
VKTGIEHRAWYAHSRRQLLGRCHLMRRISNVQNGDKPELQSRTARDTYDWECSLRRDFDVRVFSMLVSQFRVRLSAAGDA